MSEKRKQEDEKKTMWNPARNTLREQWWRNNPRLSMNATRLDVKSTLEEVFIVVS